MQPHFTNAADKFPERRQHTIFLKEPSVVHLFAEGGGVLGIMFAVYGDDWERKTGIPLALATHVREAVSTGALFVTGISIPDDKKPDRPKYWCADIIQMYKDDCKVIFPPRARRVLHLATSSGLSILTRIFNPMVNRFDKACIEDIEDLCAELSQLVPEDKRKIVSRIRETATKPWLSKSGTRTALNLCEKLTTEIPGNLKKNIPPYVASERVKILTKEIGRLLNNRTNSDTGLLKTEFMRVAVKTMNSIKSPFELRFFDSDVKEERFKWRMGNLTLNGLLGSHYIFAHSPSKGGAFSMYCRRDNMLETASHTPAKISPSNMPLWDISMATTANMLAFRPHMTEEGVLTADKAPIHSTDYVISEINRYKPVKGVVSLRFTTGHSSRLVANTQEMYADYLHSGEANEHFLNDSKSYTQSLDVKAAINNIGKDNVFIFSPEMSWRTGKERDEFPSTIITDASSENLDKSECHARRWIQDNEVYVNRTWQVLTDNLYMLGYIDRPEFDKITLRLGHAPTPVQDITPDNVFPLPGVNIAA